MAQNSTRVGISRDVFRDRQRATVTPASSIPRIQFSSGAAQGLQQFSQTLFNTSQRIEDQLDQQAGAEAQVEGATAGISGDFELRDYTTIRGREFNRSAIETFTTTLETRSIAQVAALRQQYANDPEGLQNALTLYHRGVAGELDKVSPSAGAGYLQRATTRAMPAIAAARDNAFKLTRDQADAMLISSQVALDAELKTYSADLFSDNPERSKAAASALGQVTSDLMRVYDAVDPVTGRPLYSASERAKAQAGIKSTVFRTATIGWFGEQENKSEAYLDFISGDFKIDLNMTPNPVNIIDATEGKIRDKPLTDDVKNRLYTAIEATDPGLEIMLISGGQDQAGPGARRTGSERHDHGGAGDIVLVRDGQPVTPQEDPELYRQFLGNAAAAGFTGIGHYPGFVHVGGGSSAFWGPTGSADTADPTFAQSVNEGRQNQIQTETGTRSLSAADVLSPADLRAIDAEMRSQINFRNQQADRQTRAEETERNAIHAETGFFMSTQLYNGGEEINGQIIPPLTRDLVIQYMERDEISPEMGTAFLRALAQDAPRNSDLTVYNEALRRLNEGEDIATFVLENQGNLSRAHASSLIQQSREQVDDPEGQTMTEEQRGYLGMLRNAIAPEGLLAKLDQGASIRSFEAQDEYRKRIAEGEVASSVARDIIQRSQEAAQASTDARLQQLLTPRFSVPGQIPGQIDAQGSAAALEAAFQAGNISPESYQRQRALILKWLRIQNGVE